MSIRSVLLHFLLICADELERSWISEKHRLAVGEQFLKTWTNAPLIQLEIKYSNVAVGFCFLLQQNWFDSYLSLMFLKKTNEYTWTVTKRIPGSVSGLITSIQDFY